MSWRDSLIGMPGHGYAARSRTGAGLPYRVGPAVNYAARSRFEKALCVELAKSHATRELLPELAPGHILKQVNRLVEERGDPGLQKRAAWAVNRALAVTQKPAPRRF